MGATTAVEACVGLLLSVTSTTLELPGHSCNGIVPLGRGWYYNETVFSLLKTVSFFHRKMAGLNGFFCQSVLPSICGAKAWQPLREQDWAEPETLLGSTEIANYFTDH